jgi:hypothetical protein
VLTDQRPAGGRAHHRALVQGQHEIQVLGQVGEQRHLRRARVGEHGGQPVQAQDIEGGVADGAGHGCVRLDRACLRRARHDSVLLRLAT